MDQKKTTQIDVKTVLRERKKQIEEELKKLRPLQEELREIETALRALGAEKEPRTDPRDDW